MTSHTASGALLITLTWLVVHGQATPSSDTLQNNITDGTKIDPLELAGAFEGDIILATPDEFLLMTQPGNDSLSRRAVKQRVKTWPKGAIHYFISADFSRVERGIITGAMNKFPQYTCIKFVRHTNQKDYIHIYKGNRCWSNSVGREGGEQDVSMGSLCLKKGSVMTPLMRVAGVSTMDLEELNRLYKCANRRASSGSSFGSAAGSSGAAAEPPVTRPA